MQMRTVQLAWYEERGFGVGREPGLDPEAVDYSAVGCAAE